jgi:hypothetical protein
VSERVGERVEWKIKRATQKEVGERGEVLWEGVIGGYKV